MASADGSGNGLHGMIAGSHERPDGPECRCGRAWLRWDDRCESTSLDGRSAPDKEGRDVASADGSCMAVEELVRIGDRLQSEASRIVAFIHENGLKVSYETYQAILGVESAVEEWTQERRKA